MYNIATNIKDETLIISVSGNIDSSNASNLGDDIDKARNEFLHKKLVLDLEGLQYISSAGLRIFLRLKKQETAVKLINVCTDVYDILDMTGFCEILEVEKAFRKLSVDGCEIIGEGAKGIVYRYKEDTIVKVFKSEDCLPTIRRERELSRKAFVLGLPTAIPYDIVKVGDRYGSVFELLNAKSLSKQIADDPDNLDEYVKIFADVLRQIHSTPVEPGHLNSIKKDRISIWLSECSKYFDDEKNNRLRKLVDEVEDTNNLLHGDYHTNNIMIQDKEAFLIDMDSLCYGHPVFELASIHFAYVGCGETDPKSVEDFLGMPYSTAAEIWKRFLPLYLGGDDKLSEIEDKIILLSFCRHLRHTSRRGVNTDKEKATVDYCVSKINNYLDRVDSLSF